MKVLVIGGYGFIGSHVSEELIRRGHYVRVYARRPPLFKTSAEWFFGDFHDSAKLAESLVGIDVVVHSLSSTVPATSASDPVSDIQKNLVGTVVLLQLMKEVGVGRLIYLSSGGTVYGNPLVSPVVESHPLNPISSYGAVKVAIEKFIGVSQHSWGVVPIIFRPSNPYGERQGHGGVQGLISTILSNALRAEPTCIYGDGSSVRDYIYVKDLAVLIANSVEVGGEGIYNAGSGRGFSVGEIISVIKKVTGLPVPAKYLPARDFDVKEVVLESGSAMSAFGWRPTTSLEHGVKCHFEWLKRFKSDAF
ncbi:UDP-glucose 4-epimerase [Geopseudomonas sagittaria]|uniref:UDP-glucose 4-epimerase n=1 Tax=Geopseudomonas sagittaria TaxID=1135990 RepID=A0A1I5T0K4_9GAMM|nr:NAD-dependent epimerase/dehydratase family protein [Pseudomonas sagittaria]SFP76553.1 UDP-glucose 4-epimerase [Pseudomonas sagittaria]